jgi:hypothetical protein
MTTTKEKEAERRQTQSFMSARKRRAGRATERRLAPPSACGRARLPAFHLRLFGGRTNAPVQLQAHFLGRGGRMIRKSGNRFSKKIMRKKYAAVIRVRLSQSSDIVADRS